MATATATASSVTGTDNSEATLGPNLLLSNPGNQAHNGKSASVASSSSAPHIRWQGAASSSVSRTDNNVGTGEFSVPTLPSDGELNGTSQQDISDQAGQMKEDDQTTYATARSRLSVRSFFTRSSLFTTSTGKQSQNGATWRQAFSLTMNSGFGSGAPRGGKYVGVREGRERELRFETFENGIGRTGKRPAPVPPGMLEALGLRSKRSLLADAKRQATEFRAQIEELEQSIAELERFEQVQLTSLRCRQRLDDHRTCVAGVRDSIENTERPLREMDTFTETAQNNFRYAIMMSRKVLYSVEGELEETRMMMKEYDEQSEQAPADSFQGSSSEQFAHAMSRIYQQNKRVAEFLAMGPSSYAEAQVLMAELLENLFNIQQDIERHESKNNLKHPRELLRRQQAVSSLEKSINLSVNDPSFDTKFTLSFTRRALQMASERDYEEHRSELMGIFRSKFPTEAQNRRFQEEKIRRMNDPNRSRVNADGTFHLAAAVYSKSLEPL